LVGLDVDVQPSTMSLSPIHNRTADSLSRNRRYVAVVREFRRPVHRTGYVSAWIPEAGLPVDQLKSTRASVRAVVAPPKFTSSKYVAERPVWQAKNVRCSSDSKCTTSPFVICLSSQDLTGVSLM